MVCSPQWEVLLGYWPTTLHWGWLVAAGHFRTKNYCFQATEVNGISISVSISTIVGTLDLAIDIR